MRFRFCPQCGAPLSVSRRAGVQVCPECDLRVGLRPGATVSGLLVRQKGEGPEVLLVKRGTQGGGDGLYVLPGTEVQWGEESREAVVRAVRRQAGLETEVVEAYDVHSNFHQPERLSVGTWFRLSLQGEAADPVAGESAEQAKWFSLKALPALALQNDKIVLERLAQELQEGEGIESLRTAVAELTARLNRRRRRYRDLLEAYSNELMRGAWINELHVRLGEKGSPREIADVAAEHIAQRREVDETRVWFPGPPDRCDHCPWADRGCARVQCLHLVTLAAGPSTDPESTSWQARGLTTVQPEDDRVALLRGVPAADVALQNAPIQAELPGAGAQPVRFQGFPLDVGGSVPGVLGLISREPIDANARRLYEVVARHVGTLVRNATLVEDLRAADNVKRSFIARLSHEIKTPLTAILSFAELLREELAAEGNDMGSEGAAQIEASGRKLLGIVETILEIAKLESGTVQFQPQRVNLLELIEERVPPFREQASEKDVTIQVVPPKDGTPPVVWADARRVRQTIDQLLSNATKFTKRGSIALELLPTEKEVTCRIRDTGIGIAAEHHRSVFDPFHQVSDSIHLEYGGLGLGLALAKVLVELQGGRIGVESQPGAGSMFWFSLPTSSTVGTRVE